MCNIHKSLHSPENSIFQGTMTIDTFGLNFLLEVFMDAYNKKNKTEKNNLDLNSPWVKRLAESLHFKYKGIKCHYELGVNTETMLFAYYDKTVSVFESLPDWFVEDHGIEAIQNPNAFSISDLLQFLMSYNFEKFFNDNKDHKIDFSKVKEFEIRDYQNQKRILIPITDFI